MRLVLDTNVVVSALAWGGIPYKLIEAAAAGDIELVTSPAMLAELREVLSRGHLASRLAAQSATVEQTIALDAELAITVSPLATPHVVPGDVDDDHVVAAAVAGAAEVIVSGDNDLRGLKTYQNIRIVSAAEALHIITNA